MSATNPRDANPFRFLPLLRSIATEILERTEALAQVERALLESAGRSGPPRRREERDRWLVSEASTHRREIRLAKRELERLGCSIVGQEPLTLRIPIDTGTPFRSFLWQPGRGVPEEGVVADRRARS